MATTMRLIKTQEDYEAAMDAEPGTDERALTEFELHA